jgi:hypothetical protein
MLGERAARRAEAEYDVSRMVAHNVEIYRALLGRRPFGSPSRSRPAPGARPTAEAARS